jgi:hypothetical protein
MRTVGFGVTVFLLVAVVALHSIVEAKRTGKTSEQATPPQQQAGNVPATNYTAQLIVVEDLAADVHTGSGTITISAKITNISRALIKGYATVHLLSEEGKPILSYEEELNGGEAFAHGTSVEVEVTAKVGDINKIASVTVDFTQT